MKDQKFVPSLKHHAISAAKRALPSVGKVISTAVLGAGNGDSGSGGAMQRKRKPIKINKNRNRRRKAKGTIFATKT